MGDAGLVQASLVEEGLLATVADDVPVEATGVARAVATSWVRTACVWFKLTFGRWAAAPHKLFRPENPTLGRFEDALDLWRTATRRCPHAPLQRGVVTLLRSHGVRTGLALKCRSVLVNSAMGTVLFSSYDALRCVISPRQDVPGPLAGGVVSTAAAACLAGSLHGALCAPLEIAAWRLQASGSQSSLVGAVRSAIGLSSSREPVPLPGLVVSGLLPLTVARDGAGLGAFFLTFEILQVGLLAQVARLTQLDDASPKLFARSAVTLMAGGCAGVVYKFLSWPIDLVLVRRNKTIEAACQPLPPIKAFTQLLMQDLGPKGFLPPRAALLSAFPSSALGLFVYEWLR